MPKGGMGELIPNLEEPIVNENEPYLDFLHNILSLPDEELLTTLSTSHGKDVHSAQAAYPSSSPVAMLAQDAPANSTRFMPQFPAACPSVTSVGGTQYIQPKEAVPFSSGGFSDVSARPAYQNDAVSAYLGSLGDKWKGLYNPSGRAFPMSRPKRSIIRLWIMDLSTRSLELGTYTPSVPSRSTCYTPFPISLSSSSSPFVFYVHLISPTDLVLPSAATPTFAAMISLLNSYRLSNGQPPLGFLNPFLYSLGQIGLKDIVKGSSMGCTGLDAHSGLMGPVVKGAGWEATREWDLVTGLATPDLEALIVSAEIQDLVGEER